MPGDDLPDVPCAVVDNEQQSAISMHPCDSDLHHHLGITNSVPWKWEPPFSISHLHTLCVCLLLNPCTFLYKLVSTSLPAGSLLTTLIRIAGQQKGCQSILQLLERVSQHHRDPTAPTKDNKQQDLWIPHIYNLPLQESYIQVLPQHKTSAHCNSLAIHSHNIELCVALCLVQVELIELVLH